MRNRTVHAPRSGATRRLLLRLLAILLIVLTVLPGARTLLAQAQTPSLTLTGIDTAQFPDVSATVYGEGLDDGLASTALTLFEDGVEVQVTEDQTSTVGVQVMVVLDAWEGINRNGLTGKPQRDEVFDAVKTLTEEYLDPQTDFLALTAYDNSGTDAVPQIITNWTRDHGEVRNQFVLYDSSNARPKTPLFDLLFTAIKAFDDPGPGQQRVRHLVVFSDGFDNMAVADKEDLVRQAEQRGVRIDTVQIGSDSDALRRNLENLSLNTDGSFERLNAENALLPGLWSDIGAAREQRVLTYRTTKPQPGELAVRATAGGRQLESQVRFPTLSSLAPTVTIMQPTVDTITRAMADGSAAPADLPSADLEPKSVNVQVEVAWPGDRQLDLRSVEYGIGDKTIVQSEGDLTSIDFPIDGLRADQYTIRVSATDELGQTSAAAVRPLKIEELRLQPKQPPTVAILEPATGAIERTAAPGQKLRFDTPATALEPKTLDVGVEVTWEDGQPRPLQSVEYKIGERTVVQTSEPFTRTAFPIDDLDQGNYTISVRATDAEGRVGEYTTMPLEVLVKRPPTPLPGAMIIREPVTEVITRTLADGTGPASDTPLTSLVPMTVPVNFDITWTDGQPRELTRVEYRIGDKTVVRTEPPFAPVEFPIESFDRNDYTVRVTALDEFGVKTEQIKPLTIWIAWPSPLPAWLTYASMALAGLAFVFAFVMWRNPRARRQVMDTTRRATAAVTQIFNPVSGQPSGPVMARLTRIEGDSSLPGTIELAGGITKLGRSSSNTVQLKNSLVSASHCEIDEKNGAFYVYDTRSTNGTLVNGERVGAQGHPLQAGDVIAMGPIKYRFDPSASPSAYPELKDDDTGGGTQVWPASSTRPGGITTPDESRWYGSGPTEADSVQTARGTQPGSDATSHGSTSGAYHDLDPAEDTDSTQIVNRPDRKDKPPK